MADAGQHDRGQRRRVDQRTGWGVVERCTAQTEFSEVLETAVSERVDPDSLDFDDPRLDRRYTAALEQAKEKRDEFYVMCKTGGPYLRAATMRGDEDFWMDIADDPSWARAFVDRVSEHITAVGVESIRRFDLRDTGIAIYDDVASNRGPFVSPGTYEAVFLPALRRMVDAYREAGAAKIMHHSDGDVSLLLDMWIDAGIDAINPVEYRAGMDPVAIRRKYGEQLVCVGGLDNADILPRGDRPEIRDHVNHLMQAALGSALESAYHIGQRAVIFPQHRSASKWDRTEISAGSTGQGGTDDT